MKKLSKVVSVVLAASMTVGMLAGCGSTSSTSETSTSDTFKIGSIGPLTGSAAIYGIAAMNGAQIAVDEINAAGGINGYQIEFSTQDDAHDAEKSVNAYNSLKDWGMQILAGTVTTTPCLAVADKTYKDGMLEITPSASAASVITNPNVFQVCFTDPNQGIASADYIAEHFPDATIGVLYCSNDAYSTGIRDTFVAEAAVKGLNIAAEEAFTTDTNTDFTTQLQKCQSAGVDLLFYPYYYQEASVILTEINTMGYDVTVFGVDGMDGILGVTNFDVSLAEGVYLLTAFASDAKDDATVSFVTKYKEQYGDTLNQFAADAYDVIYTIKAVLEKANCTPSMSAKEIGDVAIPAMTEITVDGLTGQGMTWDSTGAVSKAPTAVVIKDGAYVTPEE